MTGGDESGIDWGPETRVGEIEKSGIDRGLNMGVIGAEKREKERIGFFGFKTVSKVN